MGKDIDIRRFTVDDLSDEKIFELIAKKESFQIVAVKHLGSVVHRLEAAIEKTGLKCRVYTEYRSATLAGIALPTGFTQAIGVYSAISIAAHNIVTFDPDYEIAKNKPRGRVSVFYKKDSKG